MSQSKFHEITCPKCRQPAEVELYDSINTRTDPYLRNALMESNLNSTTCSNCGHAFQIEKPFLYNDPDRRLMIYWVPANDEDQETGEKEFQDLLSCMTAAMPNGIELPEIHLVFCRSELIERIFLRENDLDERIIEYIKYMILVKNEERIRIADKTLLFNAEDSNEKSLCFVVQDIRTKRLETVIEYSRHAYDAICEIFDQDDHTAGLLEMFPGPHISARHHLIQKTEMRRIRDF